MKKNKILSLLASVLILTSCGGGRTSSGDTFDPNHNDLGYQWTDESKPIISQKGAVTFNVMSSKNLLADNFNDMKVFQDLYDQTNVNVVYENMTGEQYENRKYLIIGNKNQWPDAFYHAGFSDLDIIRYSTRDVFVRIDEYLDYMPNFKRILEDRPDIKKLLTMPDGHIYSLPRVEEMGLKQYPNILFINKKWVKKLIDDKQIDFLEEKDLVDGLDISREQYKTILTKFAQLDMNGDGTTSDEIPLSFVYNSWQGNQSDLFASFGFPENRNHKTLVNGKITFTVQDDKYKDMINELAGWVNNGLITKSVFEHTQGDFLASGKAKNQRLGSFYWWEMDTVIKKEDQKDYIIVRPLKDENGKRYVGVSNEMEIDKCEVVLFQSCQYKEILLSYFDRFFNPYTSAQINYGAIGQAYEEELDSNGMLVNKALPEDMTYDEFRQKYAPMGMVYLTEPEWETKVHMEDRAKWRLNVLEEYVKPYTYEGAEQIPHIVYTLNELNQLKVAEDQVGPKIENRLVYWLTHGGVSDTEWNKFQSELETLGINKIIEINQTGYERMISE